MTLYQIRPVGQVLEPKKNAGFCSVAVLKHMLLLEASTEFVIYELEVDGPMTMFSNGVCDFFPKHITSEREVERLTTPAGGLYDPERQAPALAHDLPDYQPPKQRGRPRKQA